MGICKDKHDVTINGRTFNYHFVLDYFIAIIKDAKWANEVQNLQLIEIYANTYG